MKSEASVRKHETSFTWASFSLSTLDTVNSVWSSECPRLVLSGFRADWINGEVVVACRDSYTFFQRRKRNTVWLCEEKSVGRHSCPFPKRWLRLRTADADPWGGLRTGSEVGMNVASRLLHQKCVRVGGWRLVERAKGLNQMKQNKIHRQRQERGDGRRDGGGGEVEAGTWGINADGWVVDTQYSIQKRHWYYRIVHLKSI